MHIDNTLTPAQARLHEPWHRRPTRLAYMRARLDELDLNTFQMAWLANLDSPNPRRQKAADPSQEIVSAPSA